MIITAPSDAGDGNGGGDSTATTEGAIAITQTQDGGGNDPHTLQSPPLPPAGTTAGAAGPTAGTTGVNGAGGGGGCKSPSSGLPGENRTGHLPASMGTVSTDIERANAPAEQRELATTLRYFLTDGNINIRNLKGNYKHLTALVVVPGAYMTKVAYVHGIGATGIGQVSPVSNKLLKFFVKEEEEYWERHRQFYYHKTCRTSSGSKILWTEI